VTTCLKIVLASLIVAASAFGQQTKPSSSTAEPTGKSPGPPAKKRVSVADTLDWLKDRLASDAETIVTVTDKGNEMHFLHFSSRMEDIAGCRFTLVQQVEVSGSPSASSKIPIDLSKLRSVHVQQEPLLPDSRPNQLWEVVFYTGEASSSSEVIRFFESSIATRVAKALSDAIEKCGGKKAKELY
jgi:hypothetical protein